MRGIPSSKESRTQAKHNEVNPHSASFPSCSPLGQWSSHSPAFEPSVERLGGSGGLFLLQYHHGAVDRGQVYPGDWAKGGCG